MRTHYDPFANPNDEESWSEVGYCGTYLIDANSTNDKDLVTCKKCQNKFNQADEEKSFHLSEEAKFWDGFADFMQEQELKQDPR